MGTRKIDPYIGQRRRGRRHGISPPFDQIGRRIAEARVALGLTQEQLAAAIGSTDRSVSYWEQRDRLPQLNQLIEVAIATKQPIDYFLRDVPGLRKD